MGTKKNAAAKTPASSRNTGSRKSRKPKKSKKQTNDENIAPGNGNTSSTRKQTRKKAEPKAVTTAMEDQAALALMAMAAPADQLSDKDVPDDEIHVDGSGDDYADSNEESDSTEDTKDSESEDDGHDKELDALVKSMLAPKIKVPPRRVFSLPFEVPYKNGTRDLTGVMSNSTYDEFLLAAAGKMQTRVTLLSSIGYVPSYKKPKPAPKLLDDEDAWDILVGDVRQYIESKSKGKGQAPPFSILIVDMSAPEPSKTTGKKGGKKATKDTEDFTDGARPALKEHELFKKIETDHHCQACKTACVVLDSGDHHVLTHTELATWAMLASRHEATLGEVPNQLGLDIHHARQQRAKKHHSKVAMTSNDSPLDWVQALAPVFGALINRPPVPECQQTHVVGSDPHVIVNQPESSFLGKRPAQDDICPDIAAWLTDLDLDPVRGRMQLNYAQYTLVLRDNGFFELSDLANVSAEQLLSVLNGGMNFGVANRLVTYAKEDFAPFTTKRSRVD
ncbi:hypothetical protein K438DRAFT_1766861 [Mycena galopus ATCC 62051]|nr:hypothetical protein K438DRAFT_1766861 [Mycena galopus ATCC 62051]